MRPSHARNILKRLNRIERSKHNIGTGALRATKMEEAAGPPGPKVLRFLYFVGAGFICTIAINKWRELERKSLLKQQQQQLENGAPKAAK